MDTTYEIDKRGSPIFPFKISEPVSSEGPFLATSQLSKAHLNFEIMSRQHSSHEGHQDGFVDSCTCRRQCCDPGGPPLRRVSVSWFCFCFGIFEPRAPLKAAYLSPSAVTVISMEVPG